MKQTATFKLDVRSWIGLAGNAVRDAGGDC
jgi:hypothetical protein